jgi:hypothetical protein
MKHTTRIIALILAGLTWLLGSCGGPPSDFVEHKLEPIKARISLPSDWVISPAVALEKGVRLELMKTTIYAFGGAGEKGAVGQLWIVPRTTEQAAEDCRSAGGGHVEVLDKGATSEGGVYVVCAGSIGGKPTRVVHSYLSRPGHKGGVWCRYEGFAQWELFIESCKSIALD